jgi:hypothetical protein
MSRVLSLKSDSFGNKHDNKRVGSATNGELNIYLEMIYEAKVYSIILLRCATLQYPAFWNNHFVAYSTVTVIAYFIVLAIDSTV